MPFALLIVGAVLLVSGVRGTQDDLFTLVKGDFAGEDNFIHWVVAILAIGALGYIPAVRPFSRAFLVLVIVVLFIKNGGVFGKFLSQINGSTPTTGDAVPHQATTANG